MTAGCPHHAQRPPHAAREGGETACAARGIDRQPVHMARLAGCAVLGGLVASRVRQPIGGGLIRKTVQWRRETGMARGSTPTERCIRMARAFVASTLVCLALAAPASAEPTPPPVPDAGARPPAAAGAATAGGSSSTAPAAPAVLGPLAQQIRAETQAVQSLEQQFTQLDAKLPGLTQEVAAKRRVWEDAADALERVKARSDENAADAYKAARSLGPLGEHADELRRFGLVVPSLGQVPGTGAYGRELAQAQAEATAGKSALDTAEQALNSATARRNEVKAAYEAKKAALADLLARNSSQLAAVQAQEDAYDGAAGAQLGVGEQVAGMTANPRALQAVEHALRQLGKPYVWAAEGPDSYDCSGLTWDAYRTVGVKLPRVAADQYNATTKIQVNLLLPGDLLFFGPPGPWTGISHMGMYIGGGRMVQAPTTGDVVKISTPRWSNFYGATRVLPAVPAPQPPATQPPTTQPPTHTPTTPPSTSPPPSSNPASPPPSTSPIPSGSSASSAPSASASSAGRASSSGRESPAASSTPSGSSASASPSSG